MSELSRHNPREGTLADLITTGLGYCCEAWFWAYFKNVSTGLVAARLGVSERAVRKRRAMFKQGELVCQEKTKCLKKIVKESWNES